MSALTAKLNAVRQSAAKQTLNTINMYSANGAKFQEFALSVLDYKGSNAHQSIGALVTAINNDAITYETAVSTYRALLSN